MRARRAIKERMVAGLFVFLWEAALVVVAIGVALLLSVLALAIV